MFKLAVVVGHNAGAQGADSGYPGIGTEYKFNSEIARIMDEIQPEYGFEVAIFHRQKGLGYSSQIEKAYTDVDLWGADLSIELHFNASGREVSDPYTLTLASFSKRSLQWAGVVQNKVANLFRRAPGGGDGVKQIASNENGWLSLNAGKAPACLVEPFFGSERSECELMMKITNVQYAHVLMRAAQDMFATLPRKNVFKSRTAAGVGLQGSGTSLIMADAANMASHQFQALGYQFQTFAFIGAFLAIVGTMLTVYARLDDNKKGRR